MTFKLETFEGSFPNQNFLLYKEKKTIRLSCSQFFSKLKEGNIIYIQPEKPGIIKIYDKEPSQKIEDITKNKNVIKTVQKANKEVTNLLIDLIKENRKLRKTNEYLLIYKDKFEKFQDLKYIFDDEKAMEDWLERNIHRAIPDLEVIDRQIYLKWNEPFMKDRADLFCFDKTTKELVIIENKVRGRHKTVDTQYLKYSTWVQNNLEKINKKYKGRVKPTKNFKFVIISDTSDKRLEAICNTHNIGLVIIEGGVNIEELVPYSTL